MEVWWVALVPVGFLVIGLVFVIVGVRGWRQQGNFERRATGRATAVVTEIRRRTAGTGSDRRTIAYPIVRFTLPDGRIVEGEAMAVEHPGSIWRREGAEVPVVYDPAEPTAVAIEGATQGGRVLYGCFAAFGAMFALIGLVVILLGVVAAISLSN